MIQILTRHTRHSRHVVKAGQISVMNCSRHISARHADQKMAQFAQHVGACQQNEEPTLFESHKFSFDRI